MHSIPNGANGNGPEPGFPGWIASRTGKLNPPAISKPERIPPMPAKRSMKVKEA